MALNRMSSQAASASQLRVKACTDCCWLVPRKQPRRTIAESTLGVQLSCREVWSSASFKRGEGRVSHAAVGHMTCRCPCACEVARLDGCSDFIRANDR